VRTYGGIGMRGVDDAPTPTFSPLPTLETTT